MATSSEQAGLQALAKGQPKDALDALKTAAANAPLSLQGYIGLAESARQLGQSRICAEAADRAIALDRHHPEALTLKGDALAAAGRPRDAGAFYQAALQAAQGKPLSHAQQVTLRRAQEACQRAAQDYENFLREQIKPLGVFDGRSTNRLEQAFDIMFGRRQIYLQQPTKFYFPELPQRQFYSCTEFPWASSFMDQWRTVRDEFLEAIANNDRFEPYVPAQSETPHLPDPRMMGNSDWGALHLIKDGEKQTQNCDACPKTVQLLADIQQPTVRGKCPIALFSRLKPGAHIPPHTGLMNTRLICHLPIIAPEGCTLRVGNQQCSWTEGELIIFDDSIEHEARNNARTDRIVLLFDIWRPELSAEERIFVETIFAGIEAFGA